ncbi:MAG: aminotransferase class V-fold PLP-dependent enzyme [Verrucomicrobia bacterium]|nr:aminotransferase class V-fold PLP-dependent enzyme [Verrucomicrobiota bacterium]
MLRVGAREAEAVARVIRSGKLFRYHSGGECERFEERYAKRLGVKQAIMTSSGTTALTAALAGLDIGPGDEVVVPACTYMATAVAVLAVGAIPVIVDIDDTLTLSPKALDAAIGPHTRAVIPVHMWGLPCDMRAILRVARKHKLLVIEDACQAVGGGYRGKPLGTWGHAGAFSFNYFKNMTCGEGGALVTNRARVANRGRCMVDCCGFYWNGRKNAVEPFTSNGSRASELEGAMMNIQLDQLSGMMRRLRRLKQRLLRETATLGLKPIRVNSPSDECATHLAYQFSAPSLATAFADATGGVVAANTGRHVYTEWDPIFAKQGAHHPALNPFTLPQNRRCRKTYRKNMCAPSLAILNRTVLITLNPDFSAVAIKKLTGRIKRAAAAIDG